MNKWYLLCICLFLQYNGYAQDIAYAKSVINKLASPEMYGRGYTHDGNQLAAGYISSEFKRLGLLSFGKSYYQKFTIPVNTFPGEMELKINGENLKPGADFIVEASSPGIDGKFKVVRTNRSELTSRDRMLDVVNKAGENFILIDNTDKSQSNKDINQFTDELIQLLKYSNKIHCKGIMVYTKDKPDWDASTFVNVRTIITVNKELDISKIETIEVHIKNKFISACQTQNIIGYIQGRVRPDSFVVATAHYDHLGEMGKGIVFPGANDNASGIAMLLNLAQYYSKNPPACSIAFIALGAEELGILGAKYYSEMPVFPLNKIRFLVNFDLAGTGDEGIKVVNGSVYKDKFDLLCRLNTEGQLVPKVDIRGAACNSDHCMFYQKGVPCFYIYTQGGIKAYHDIYDRAETLPLTEFEDYCRLMIRFFDTF